MIKTHSGNPESNERQNTGMAKDCLLEERESDFCERHKSGRHQDLLAHLPKSLSIGMVFAIFKKERKYLE